MSVRQTSINAYYEKVNSIKASLYLKILETIKEFDKKAEGITRCEIATYSKIEKSTVSARVNELIKLGILYEDGKRKDRFTNITSLILKINKERQNKLF